MALAGEHHVLTSQLVIDAGSSLSDIVEVRNELKDLLHSLAFEHTILEIELGRQTRGVDEK